MPTTSSDLTDIFPGEGAVTRLMRTRDWSATPLGDPRGWPEGLMVPLRMMLSSRFEMWLGWGPDVRFFYNDAYVPTLGNKHPAALGEPMQKVWKEIYADVEDRVRAVMDDGIATWDDALLLLLERNGYPEETYHTFSYSPLRGDSGAIEGLMCVVTEVTDRVIGDRRLATLRGLAASLLGDLATDAVLARAGEALAANQLDFPFALLFGKGADGAWKGQSSDSDGAALLAIEWPLDGDSVQYVPLEAIADLPTGAWAIPPVEALVVPIVVPGGAAVSGALVLALNPHRPGDPEIQPFAQLIGGQVAAALGNAAALAGERRRADRVWKNSRDLLVVIDTDGVFRSVSPAWTNVLGHMPEEVLGKTVFDFIAPEDERSTHGALDEAPGQNLTAFENRYVAKDGARRTISWNTSFEDGLIYAYGRDVTAERAGAEALQLAQSRVRAVFETSAAFQGFLDPEGVLLDANRASLEALDVPVAHTLGKPFWETRWFTDTPGMPARIEAAVRAAAAGETVRQEITLHLPSGARSFDFSLMPVRDGAGEVIGIVPQSLDITVMREAELALRQAQKMESVGQLTGGIAHDFNNLLTGISGSLELMAMRVDQGRYADVQKYIGAAQGAARRAAALTQRLLAFARRQTLDPRPTDVNRLVVGMEDLIRRSVGPTAEIEVIGAGGLWPTLIDPPQLENALLNLCINARDAMPQGGRITIETANKWLDDRAAKDRDLPPGQYVSLCVTDAGTGMTEAVIARAFDPFFTTKPIGVGTGLGLSMIYGFVRQSGGQVRIYSEVGQGTTICLYLPRYHGDAPLGEAVQTRTSLTPVGAGEVVLVVDDEPTVRMLVAEVLDEAGYASIEASDGASALAILASDARIDLLVTDVGLPNGMNGRQVADAARVSRPGLKVLFITGYAENAAVGNGLLEPGMELLTKPFEMQALAAKIQAMIKASGRA